MAPLMRTRHFRKDDAILCHGDKADNLWVVVSGWLKLTRQTPDGKETIIGLCTDGDILGEAALFAHAQYPYHAEVLGAEATVVVLPADVVRNLVKEDSSFSASIMHLLNERMFQAQLKLEHMSTMSAAQRLGCFLLRLCHSQEHGSRELDIPVEKHILAAFLGMKPETLSRSQQQLKEAGVVVKGQHIVINNITALRQYVCNSCSESGACDAEADDE